MLHKHLHMIQLVDNKAGLVFVYYRHQGGRNNWGLQQTIHAQLTNGE